MRTAFIEQLVKEARKNENIFLVVGDLGFSVIEPFAEEFPNRFLNVGVAEQNMAGIASGLAMDGYCVYIYSIGNFPTLRCMEQIRYDICYHNLNVKIVAVGGGYSYGSLGPSHHTTEEIGMLKTLPNLIVSAPGDPLEAELITKFSSNHIGPMYIRLGRAGEPDVHLNKIQSLYKGEILKVIDNNCNTAIFTTGSMLKYSKDFIIKNKLNVSLYSFPFIKPINNEILYEIIIKYKKIITIEEHQKTGGFGSSILESVSELQFINNFNFTPPIIIRKAINDNFQSIAGSQYYLQSIAGIHLDLELFNNEN